MLCLQTRLSILTMFQRSSIDIFSSWISIQVITSININQAKLQILCNWIGKIKYFPTTNSIIDGHIILGTCDLTGRLWTGSLWYYRDPHEAPSVQKALTGVDCDSGVIDGKFIGNKSKDVRKYSTAQTPFYF